MGDIGGSGFQAEIRYTADGVAHVRAADWGGLGFGQGWACARDHLPTIADQIVKVRSERARFHGPGPNAPTWPATSGTSPSAWWSAAVALRDAQPPRPAGPDLGLRRRATTRGGRRGAPTTARCPSGAPGAGWVRPIDELDLYAYFVDVALLASGRNLAAADRPGRGTGPDGPAPPSPVRRLRRRRGRPGASNGWAFGGDVTASGHGIVLANPHFPWGGEARFWECHLTIPGELDVYGVSLLGTPGVQMGFNADVAWAHTFSCGHRFTLYQLDARRPVTRPATASATTSGR